jgi:GWxTD domain-containing protein
MIRKGRSGSRTVSSGGTRKRGIDEEGQSSRFIRRDVPTANQGIPTVRKSKPLCLQLRPIRQPGSFLAVKMKKFLIPIAVTVFSCFVRPSLARAQFQPTSQNGRLDVEENSFVQWLTPIYRDWLAEDVGYIITKEELWAFLQLTNDADRDLFIQQFWERRSPDPDSQDNSFESEHYRRISYSNDHFSAGSIAGWKTDRGRIYIEFGPPDEIVQRSVGVAEFREVWRYRYLEGIGEDAEYEFTDSNGSGDYRLDDQPPELGDRFQFDGSIESGCTGCIREPVEASAEEISSFVPRFKDLAAVAVAHLIRDDVSFKYHFAPVPVTSFTALVPVTIEVPFFEFSQQGKTDEPVRLNLFCRISDANGRIVETLEETIPQAASARQDSAEPYPFQKSVPLRPGLYEIAIVVGNPESGNVGSAFTELVVPSKTTQK